jgi:lysophospholipase L1-like esterase
MWNTLAGDFPSKPVINRGFGGATIADCTHFADRIIFPHAPKMILLRAGGNDIHLGKSAEQVFADYQAFVAAVHAKLPETTIMFISQCPTPARWVERDALKVLNRLVEDYTKRSPQRLEYVETYDSTLTPDGNVREDLFVADRLHFNANGYKLLTERIRPVLAQ